MAKSPELMAMFEALVATPSVSSTNPDLDMSNRPVIDLLASWLNEAGFSVETQDLPEHPDKANLIATLGSGEDGLVLAGHTDTVPFDEDRWRYEPFKLTEDRGRLYGLGSCDMKGFLAIAIAAARQFRANELRAPLTLVATADEESAMTGARHLATRIAGLGRYCVIGEPTRLVPIRQHKGIFMEAIRLRGQSGHSSNPALGNNALEGMQSVIGELLRLRAELAAESFNPAFEVSTPTLNLGHIHGGDNPNRICGECELHIDLRFLPGMEISELRRRLRHRVSNAAWQHGLQCDFRMLFEGIPAMETRPDSAIVRLAESLTGQAGAAVAFGTEGPYFNTLGLETIIMGPGDIAQAHQPDESIAAGQVARTEALLGQLIHALCVDEPTAR